MMPHKKKLFNKGNSEKFILLRGSSQAVNADGETLQNVLVPVSKSYKPGSSLLMSNIAVLSNLKPDDDIEELKDIEGVFDDASTVDDSSAAEVIVEDLLSDMKKLKLSSLPKKFDTFDDDYDVEERDGKYSKQFDSRNFQKCSENWKMLNKKFSDDDDAVEDVIEDRKISTQNDPKNYEYCSENWKMFNEKFDEILEEYTDDKIGALDDDDDICFMQRASPEPFIHDIDDHHKELELVLGDFDEELKEKILNYVEDNSDEKMVEIVTKKPIEFDCESILSTYSNKYNHPTVIKEEKTPRIRSTSHNEVDSELHSRLLTNTCNIRKKSETPEERKERQRRFKEAKKLRRELKKQNKGAFKEEKKVQSLKDQQNAGMKLL